MKKLFVALFSLLSACISFQVEWERVESTQFTSDDGSFHVELPVGWGRAGALLTKDGTGLQRIWILRLSEETLELIPSAEQLAASLAESPACSNVESTHVSVAGRPATELSFAGPVWPPLLFFDALDGLSPQELQSHRLYWFTVGEQEFVLGYSAVPFYFERDLPVFERLVASFEPLPSRTDAARLPQ